MIGLSADIQMVLAKQSRILEPHFLIRGIQRFVYLHNRGAVSPRLFGYPGIVLWDF